MATIVILFYTSSSANRLVAGIPAAARAVGALFDAKDGVVGTRCIVAVPGGWQPTRWCREELVRLAPGVTVQCRDEAALDELRAVAFFRGVELIWGNVFGGEGAPACASTAVAPDRECTEAEMLKSASRSIIAATGKTSDGFVSRNLNRPISRFITRQALRPPWVVPMHGTVATGVIGVAMAISLFSGCEAGLIAGAILLHAASVIDGVDGEIARATKRSSRLGATLDSATDGLINIVFVCGVTANLWMRGDLTGAAAGASGASALALGLLVLAMRSLSLGEPINFDAVKTVLRAKASGVGSSLAKLASRDFYAAAFALLVPLGFVQQALFVFAAAAMTWLLVISWVLFQTRPNRMGEY